MDRTACTEPQWLYKGALYLYLTVELYLYSPYGPYGLYRTSVPVQGCTFQIWLPCRTTRTKYQNHRILNERRSRSDSLLYLRNKEQQTNKIQCRKEWHFFVTFKSPPAEALHVFNITVHPVVHSTFVSSVYTEHVPTICFVSTRQSITEQGGR
jgi:hypothetical protein